MKADAIANQLTELGLRLPDAEMDAFVALVTDMQAAAEFARRELPYRCEPASIFALHPAAP